jgi:hypothetical protein
LESGRAVAGLVVLGAGRGVVESGSESTRGRRRGAGLEEEVGFGLEGPEAGGKGGMDRAGPDVGRCLALGCSFAGVGLDLSSRVLRFWLQLLECWLSGR